MQSKEVQYLMGEVCICAHFIFWTTWSIVMKDSSGYD